MYITKKLNYYIYIYSSDLFRGREALEFPTPKFSSPYIFLKLTKCVIEIVLNYGKLPSVPYIGKHGFKFNPTSILVYTLLHYQHYFSNYTFELLLQATSITGLTLKKEKMCINTCTSNTVDREIFVLNKFHKLNFRK